MAIWFLVNILFKFINVGSNDNYKGSFNQVLMANITALADIEK